MSYEKVKQAENLTVGVKQTVKALQQRRLTEVVVAKDADAHVTAQIVALCDKYGVPLVYVDSMMQLGKASNIDVRASAVGICK